MRQAWANAAIAVVAIAAATVSIIAVPGVRGWLGAALAVVAAAVAAVDARRFIIPNELSLLGFALALAHAWVSAPGAEVVALAWAIVRGATMALLFFLLREIYLRVRGRAGLGLGDVKLAAVAGAWL